VLRAWRWESATKCLPWERLSGQHASITHILRTSQIITQHQFLESILPIALKPTSRNGKVFIQLSCIVDDGINHDAATTKYEPNASLIKDLSLHKSDQVKYPLKITAVTDRYPSLSFVVRSSWSEERGRRINANSMQYVLSTMGQTTHFLLSRSSQSKVLARLVVRKVY